MEAKTKFAVLRIAMNINDVAVKLSAQITVKLSQDLHDRLKRLEEKNGIVPADAMRRLAEAMLEFYDKNGFFAFPVKLEPEADWLQRALIYRNSQNDAGLAKTNPTPKAKK